jgi:hypothetical protein
MEPLEFLAAVLPPPGNGRYCVAELTKKKEHVYVDTLEEAQNTLERWNKANLDIYFGLSTYGNVNKREATNTQMAKCIAIDIDCSHPKDVPDEHGTLKPKAYPSAKAAAQAILDFSAEVGLSGLGEPWMVASGGGVHAYWPLREAVEIGEWKPVAEAFKRLCVQKKLGIDPTVTGDAARVLRIPATTNSGIKAGRRVRGETKVRFMHSGDFFDIGDIRGVLETQLAGTPYEVKPVQQNTLTIQGQRPKQAPVGGSMQLFANSITKFGNIYKATKRGEGCDQLAFYALNASDDGMEPLWRGMLSIAQKCEDGEKAAKWLSDLHPYSEDRMRNKLSEIKGPYPCTKFDSENPGVCINCKHWGKITNPLALGRDTAVVTAEQEVEVKPSGTDTFRKAMRPEAPFGYAYGRNGGVYIERLIPNEDGTESKKLTLLLSYDLFPINILDTAGEHTVHMLALRPEGTQNILLPQKSCVSKDDMMKCLATQNVLAAFGAGNDKNFFDYVRASVEKMSTDKLPVKVPASYGWQKDNSFVYSGRIYAPNVEPMEIPMVGLENIINNTQPAGTIQGWRNVINLLIQKKLYDQLAIVLVGAGAPLMKFTGIYGMTFHCASTYSGTGKSLALEGAASIWGHPVHYRIGKSSSPVAMQQRLGALNSLPLITDEITSKNRAAPEWFSEFLLDMTEGRGKERMEAGANKERINNSTWMSNALMSSNTYVVDTLLGTRKHAAEGEIRRVIEFDMDTQLAWDAYEIEVIKSLANNYGVAGDMFAQYLVDNFDKVAAMVPEVVRKMYTEYKATNDERFWMAGIGSAVAAGILFSDNNAGIANFPMPEIIAAFGKRVGVMRKAMHGNQRSAEDVLNAFVREGYGHFVIVNYGAAGGVLAQMGDGAVIDKSTTRSAVHGRIENGLTPGCVDMYIEERVLRTFCASMSFGYADFKKQLEAHPQMSISYVARKDLMAKTNGPQMRVAAIRITRPLTELDVPENTVPLGKG